MFFIKSNIVYFTLLDVLVHIWSLEELRSVEDNDITITEKVIRDTVNNLFTSFRINDVQNKPRLKEFATVHDLFVSITSKYWDNLKEIAKFTRVNNIDNNTQVFITKVNEVLDEGDKTNEVDDMHVTTYIETFIKTLRQLKESYTFNRDYSNYSINAKVLKHLTNDGILNGSNHSVLGGEDIWRPTERSGRRIYKGHRTRIKHFPFIASVQFFKKFQCAGSIIQSDLIITAASCLQLAWNNRFFRENPAFLSVQVGCDFYEAGGENIPVLEIYFHPDYEPKNLRNNLAIMRLTTTIVFSKKSQNVKRIKVDPNPSPLPVNIDGITLIGWGAHDASNVIYNPWQNRLSYAELDYYPLHECREIYSGEYVTRKHFCAGFFSKGSGACNRDVGGPGVAGGMLLGVVSFGPPICGTADAPTVFTKVGFYKDWIEKITKQVVPSVKKLTTLLITKPTYKYLYPDLTEHTRVTFTVQPVAGRTPKLIPITLPGDTLRILKDDKLFKEFLSTMFESDEKNYLDSSSEEASKKTKVSKKTTAAVSTKNVLRKGKLKKKKAKTTSTTTVTTPANDDDEYETESEAEDKGEIKQILRTKMGTYETTTISVDTGENVTIDEDTKLENDITNLLDDLDIQKLLESEELLNSGDEPVSIVNRALEESESGETEVDIKNTGKESVEAILSSTEVDKSENNEGLNIESE